MSLALAHERHRAGGARPDRATLADDLAGNLCRCTGYRPILDAGERMADLPGAGLPLAGLAEQLRASAASSAPAWTGPAATTRRADVAALAALRLSRPQARLVAGATDIGLWVTKQFSASWAS